MEMPVTATLGTLLRHLIEVLDGAVEESYIRSGLDYRPRYTPIVRALIELGPASMRAISVYAGITHSAVSQTVSQMVKKELVFLKPGEDMREKIVSLTPRAESMIPALKHHWAATEMAARALEKELPMPLSSLVRETLTALDRKSFPERIGKASEALENKNKKRGINVIT
jgi:DNA-binding MarR family transcriptional regulator